MVPTICAWHLPTNQLLLPITLCLVPSYLPTNDSHHLCLVPTNQPTNVTYHLCLVPSYLPTNGTYHLCLVPSYLSTYQWYLPPMLSTLLPSYLPPYLPNVPTTCAWYLPTNHLLGYVADTERGRERERETDGLHLCTRRSFHGFFSQSCALNCSPVRGCCCSSRSLYVSVCM